MGEDAPSAFKRLLADIVAPALPARRTDTAGREIGARLVPAIHRFESQLMGVLADDELGGLLDLVAPGIR